MRSRLFSAVWIVTVMLALFAAGCGDDDEPTTSGAAATTATAEGEPAESEEEGEESEEEREREEEEREEAKSACKTDATSKATGLPDGFPLPDGVTVTKAEKEGPTNVVEGYWEIDLDTAYERYGDEVDTAGYTVLAKEHEAHDAEINYRGEEREGQIALRETCSESDTLRVRITNRPE